MGVRVKDESPNTLNIIIVYVLKIYGNTLLITYRPGAWQAGHIYDSDTEQITLMSAGTDIQHNIHEMADLSNLVDCSYPGVLPAADSNLEILGNDVRMLHLYQYLIGDRRRWGQHTSR